MIVIKHIRIIAQNGVIEVPPGQALDRQEPGGEEGKEYF
jgi:hypothetical protein